MKMTAENVNLWYGDFHALKGVSLNMEVNQVTALIGPSGCGKSTFLKSLNRMNDLVEGCRIEGSICLDGRGYLRQGLRCGAAAQARGHGLSKAQPVPHEHL